MDRAINCQELAGLKVLVVEDEALTALQLEDMLESLGCEVVGPAARVQRALEMLESGSVDFAILDLNVAGELVYPVAEQLVERDLPFIFATGLGVTSLAPEYRDRQALQKPLVLAQLRAAIQTTLDPSQPADDGGAPGTPSFSPLS